MQKISLGEMSQLKFKAGKGAGTLYPQFRADIDSLEVNEIGLFKVEDVPFNNPELTVEKKISRLFATIASISHKKDKKFGVRTLEGNVGFVLTRLK